MSNQSILLLGQSEMAQSLNPMVEGENRTNSTESSSDHTHAPALMHQLKKIF